MRRADEKEMKVMFDSLEEQIRSGLEANDRYPHEFARQAGWLETSLSTLRNMVEYWRKTLDIDNELK